MVKNTCSKCGENNDRIGQRYCKKCHAEYMRLNRPKHSELTPIQKLKANARAYLNVYVKRGIVLKEPCSVCGDNNSEGHHENYTKPLDVVWFCRKHHLEHHNS